MGTTGFIEQAAKKISQLGLTVPAILLLEAHKPVSFLGSQLVLIAQPTLQLFLPRLLLQHAADLLASPDQIDQLIARLEHQANLEEGRL